MTLPLDGLPEPPPAPPIDETPDRRRTRRQHEQVAAGIHPLMAGPLHPGATREVSPHPPPGTPYTCGSCRFRQFLRWHDPTYPKCVQESAPTPSHGPATDVRAWWPGCRFYEAGDARLSPDASRVFP